MNPGFTISAVSYMEVIQGVQNATELRSFLKALQIWAAGVIHINEAISQEATNLVQRYALSHSLQLADALIAATAIHRADTLVSANAKHYRFVSGIELQRFVP